MNDFWQRVDSDETANQSRQHIVCGVCGRPAVGVASSTLGGFSTAYCGDCLRNNAEPAGEIGAQAEMVGGVNHLAEWVLALATWHDGRYMSAREYLQQRGED